jgi:hypothetical protein
MNSARLLVTALALHAAADISPALGCACCSNTASRYVEVEPLSAQRANQIEQMNFAKTAKLATGEADAAIKGVSDPATDYQLAVTRSKERIAFSFRDAKRRAGTLTLVMPKSVSIFEVDPRGGTKDEGLGPVLYKEWKLTADANGDGLFKGVAGRGQKLTLILHGAGRGCTEASHFTDWTLLVHGKERLTLYGALER